MNKRYIIACLAVWVFFFIYDGIFHGQLLQPFYHETESIWRPQNEMEAHMIWMVAAQGIFAFLFGLIFTKGYENKGVLEGARYGWWIGLLLAATYLFWYAILPVPGMVPFLWALGILVELTLAGMLLAAIYRPLPAS